MSVQSNPPSPRQKWVAIALATMLLLVSYWLIVFAFVAGVTEDGPDPGPPLAVGLSLVPFVFLVLAFLTRHPRAPGAVLKAMGLFVVVGMPVALFGSIVPGMVAGFGAGGVVSLRAEEEHRWAGRAAAVAGVTAYVWILLQFIPDASIFGGPFLPFVSIGIADGFMERRAPAADPDVE